MLQFCAANSSSSFTVIYKQSRVKCSPLNELAHAGKFRHLLMARCNNHVFPTWHLRPFSTCSLSQNITGCLLEHHSQFNDENASVYKYSSSWLHWKRFGIVSQAVIVKTNTSRHLFTNLHKILRRKWGPSPHPPLSTHPKEKHFQSSPAITSIWGSKRGIWIE